ncbi:MAG: LptF/LptG family permease [Bacteroidales bacterium]|nr:LptF/LptG family permease [Bacteroidales bacterium]MCL2133671.1 LptF/LptG family permease [Bacteroidales bacterium]
MNKLKPKIIDWYIIRKFIGTYFFSILVISVIVVIFDLSEKVDDFAKTKPSLYAVVVNYYMNFIPYIANMFSPLFVFITVIFFTSKMAGHSEIIAILSGGVSFRRLMYPYFLSTLIIFIMTLALSLFVIPPANSQRLSFEEKYAGKKVSNSNNNIHFQLDDNRYVYMASFATWDNSAHRFSLEEFEGQKLKSKLTSDRAVWDTSFNGWRVQNYVIRTVEDSVEVITRGATLDTIIGITAADLRRYREFNESLNLWELNENIEQLKMRGDNSVKFALIEKNRRIAIPFSVFILTLMGVSLSSRKMREGMGIKIGVGIALSFCYILFLRFSEMFVYADTLPPFIALWLPNILFAIVAIGLYIKAPK